MSLLARAISNLIALQRGLPFITTTRVNIPIVANVFPSSGIARPYAGLSRCTETFVGHMSCRVLDEELMSGNLIQCQMSKKLCVI